MKFNKKKCLFFLLLFCVVFNPLSAQQLAFPGAEGFGAYASGGRGGTVVHVTNLNESGTGSLMDAVSQPNRIVVFDVGGVINLSPSAIISVASNVTVAGQTAPGGGITIYGNRVVTNGTNVILRFLRMRGSINMASDKCAVTVDGASNIIYDHCSISWGRWDNVHITNSNNITFQYCIIGEGIAPQKFGAITDGTRNWTVSHCLWINNTSRNPKMKCFLQYINNVVYNYGNGIVGGHSAADNYQDVINNYFIAGPSASGGNYLSDWTATDHFYSSGNYVDLNKNGILDGTLMTDYNGATVQSAPYLTSPVPVTTQSAADAYKTVLNDVGASLVRDVTDTRNIAQLSSLGTLGAIILSDADVNGPGVVANGTPPLDTDNDGMPDSWELSKGLNPNSAVDSNGDANGNGYTNIEDYLNYKANTNNVFRAPSLTALAVSKTEIDLSWTIASNTHTGFIIEKSLNSVDWTQLADVAATANSYKDLSLTQNTKYNYRIKAYNSTESSDYSFASALTQSDSPINPVPENRSANLDSSTIVFSWNASSEVLSYDFFLGTDPGNLVRMATGLTAKTYTAKNLKEGTTYYWRVDAITANGTSSSAVWSFTTKRSFPAGMVAWYKLDDKASIEVVDSSVYKKNGYLMDVDTTAWQSGLFNGCVNTIGADLTGHMEIPHTDPLFIDKGSFSISFWMKCASQNAVLFEKLGTDLSGLSKGYTVELSTTALKITLFSGTTNQVSSATLPTGFFNRWNHIALYRDTAVNRIRIYINSAWVGNLTTTAKLDISNSASLFIANNSSLAKPYQGQLDDIRFYNVSFYANNLVNILYNEYPAPDKANYLFPAKNDSCYDNIRLPLTWLSGPNSFNPTFDVYLGTDPNNLQLKLADQTTMKNVLIPTTLNPSTIYYWRVDSKNAKGISTGDVWSFKTKNLYPKGMVGNWKLDESTGVVAVDSSIYRNNGTISKLTGNPIHEAGRLMNCVNFSNGRDSSHIVIPASNPLYVDNSPFSISLWMKLASSPAASSYLIHKGSFAADTQKNTNGKWYGLEFKGTSLTFAVDDDVTKTALTTTSAEFCTGQWVHLVAIRDTINKQLALYRNGLLVKTIADATGSIGNAENIYLANVREMTAPYFGSLDEVKLFNYALNPVEVVLLSTEKTPVGLVMNPLKDGVSVYPNPTSGIATIHLSKLESKIQVIVENLNGIVLFSTESQNAESIDVNLSSLNSGLYILKIKNGDKLIVRKILKK